MRTAFFIHDHAKHHFLGTRFRARELRGELEAVLEKNNEVVLDFTGMLSATQSSIDELLGVLILKHGPDLTQRLVFKGCSEDVREVIRFVVATRTEDYLKKNQH